ncbi:sporulation protein [Bacillus sp. DNRA2]|uniref:sporulation protein n=1 Tax=Bacillus sp. DNRA2 TaxID=2723053 RepID=UPI00145ED10B|nr:sporulation protein [Bacillus sp. DNRA2]NMD71503.1 sporulation protein [Bacillus sp. DNRA2]
MKTNLITPPKLKWILAFIIVVLGGCTNYSGSETKVALLKKVDPRPTVFGTNESEDMETLKKVRKEVMAIEPVYDVAIVKGKKDTVVAYKVKHMHRFRMKQIEKEINEKLEKKFPKEDFIISSDYKIFLDVIELINDENDPKHSDKEAEKKLNEIIELKKELT